MIFLDLIKTAHRLSRAIERNGTGFVVTRQKKNGFGDLAEEPEVILRGRGLYHTESVFLDLTPVEGGKTRTRRKPRLLILPQDGIQRGDALLIGKEPYTVTGLEDLGGLGIACDLSLEAIHV